MKGEEEEEEVDGCGLESIVGDAEISISPKSSSSGKGPAVEKKVRLKKPTWLMAC